MTTYYEVFFDSPELRDFWGTSEVQINGDIYEICSQSYYVACPDNNIILDNEEMCRYLAENHAPRPGFEDDLINCVETDTLENIFAFVQIDEDEYNYGLG